MKNIIEAITGTRRGRALAFACIAIMATLLEAGELHTFSIYENYSYSMKLLGALVANAVTAFVLMALYEYLLKKPKLKPFLQYVLIVGFFGAIYAGIGLILLEFFQYNYFVNEVLKWPFIILLVPAVYISVPIAILIENLDFVQVDSIMINTHLLGWYLGILVSITWSVFILLAIKIAQIIKAKRPRK